MANIDAAFGLRPYNMLGAGANTNGNSTYLIQTVDQAGSIIIFIINHEEDIEQ